jgi:hypothetical protein
MKVLQVIYKHDKDIIHSDNIRMENANKPNVLFVPRQGEFVMFTQSIYKVDSITHFPSECKSVIHLLKVPTTIR